MRRDVDLQRSILAFVEEHSPPRGGLDREVEIEGYDRDTVLAHIDLLIKDAYIEGKVLESLTGLTQALIMRLTNRGHDAIAAIKSDTLWEKTKGKAAKEGIALAFSTIVELVKLEARRHLGLP
jgi:Hypothetical protein (DUF2513)